MIIHRHTIPITARDFSSIQDSVNAFIRSAYGGKVDELSETELYKLQIAVISLITSAFYCEAERAGGESTLATAVEPQSVLDIVSKMYGYVPPGPVPAKF